MKTLIFEGAGCTGTQRNDVENCRIRTRIRNNDGRVIYLEMGGFEVGKGEKREMYKNFKVAAHIDHCFYDDAKWDSRRNYSADLRNTEREIFEYTKENIIKFVNENLNCNFDNIEVINDNSVRVHDTEEPLCDCSNGDYEPFKEIEININVLDGVRPTLDYRDRGFAQYRISYDFVKECKYLKQYIQGRTEREQQQFSSYNFIACLRWDKSGIITSLEITARQNFCSMGLGVEDLKAVIDEIKKCSLVMVV